MLATAAQAVDVYLSTDGSDFNSGLAPSVPVQSLNRAIAIVANLNVTEKNDFRIVCGGGIYEVPSTVEVARGACAKQNSLRMVVARGDNAIFSGGTIFPAAAWTKDATVPTLYKSEPLPGSQFKQQIVRNAWGASCGVRRPLAETATLQYESAKLTANPPMLLVPTKYRALLPLNASRTVAAVSVLTYHCQTSTINRVVKYDPESGWLTLAGTIPDASECNESSGNRFRLQNVPVVEENVAMVNAFHPHGSFSFDPASRRISYRLSENEAASNGMPDLIIPRLETIFRTASPCFSVFMEGGVQFANTDSFLEESCIAYGCGGAGGLAQEAAAVDLSGLYDSALVGVHVWATGGYGIWIHGGSRNVSLSQMEVFDLGAGGVRIGDKLRLQDSSKVKDQWLAAERITVEDTSFSYGGQVIEAGSAVMLVAARNSTITHNYIFRFKGTGVSIVSSGEGSGFCSEVVVSFNRLQHIGQGILSDVACVSTIGEATGLLFDHNLCSDVQSFGFSGWGLFVGPGTSNATWTNNVVFRTKGASFYQVQSVDSGLTLHVVRNNVFAFPELIEGEIFIHNSTWIDTRFATFGSSNSQPASPSTFTNVTCNLFLIRNKTAAIFYQPELGAFRNFRFDWNLYWTYAAAATTLRFPTLNGTEANFSTWQAEGEDTHSLVADPALADAENDDFSSFYADSPVFALGILPINTSCIGPRGSPPPEAPSPL